MLISECVDIALESGYSELATELQLYNNLCDYWSNTQDGFLLANFIYLFNIPYDRDFLFLYLLNTKYSTKKTVWSLIMKESLAATMLDEILTNGETNKRITHSSPLLEIQMMYMVMNVLANKDNNDIALYFTMLENVVSRKNISYLPKVNIWWANTIRKFVYYENC